MIKTGNQAGTFMDSTDSYNSTPPWCVERLLDAVDIPGGRWLDPAVGEGAIVSTISRLRRNVYWTTMDKRQTEWAQIVGDYTAEKNNPLDGKQPISRFDCIITQPPFDQAIEFVRQSTKRAKFTALFLRLNFLATAKRSRFFFWKQPNVYVIPERIRFRENAPVDPHYYAWFTWFYDGYQRIGTIRVLDPTPLEFRIPYEYESLFSTPEESAQAPSKDKEKGGRP